jgi:hypothetical protein
VLSLEEPLGPPGVGLAPGGGAPQPPANPPIRRETLARSVCQGLLLRSYTPRLGAAVVSPAIHILKTHEMDAGLTHSKQRGATGGKPP